MYFDLNKVRRYKPVTFFCSIKDQLSLYILFKNFLIEFFYLWPNAYTIHHLIIQYILFSLASVCLITFPDYLLGNGLLSSHVSPNTYVHNPYRHWHNRYRYWHTIATSPESDNGSKGYTRYIQYCIGWYIAKYMCKIEYPSVYMEVYVYYMLV